MAEIMERSEWFRDRRLDEGGFEVLASDACGVEWGAFVGVAEDEVVVCLVGGLLPVFGE
jgi:hypothetical protein